ncbi:phostensin-like [Callorhinchus milii]|uniref:Phostensin/Taperin PP1-binding domain-containing protein n=1 Tax=Callorhinchus milii TaxID=7868 RepID=A0A4W3GFI2_CALMI|nr:phostensin-like [Callorhinchus milii]
MTARGGGEATIPASGVLTPTLAQGWVLSPVTDCAQAEPRGSLRTVRKKTANTITIVPRRCTAPNPGLAPAGSDIAVSAVGLEVAGSSQTPASGTTRFPTAEQIQVIGGYLTLHKSCLATPQPHAHNHRTKLRISFADTELETCFRYPSEVSFLTEPGTEETATPNPPPTQHQHNESCRQ